MAASWRNDADFDSVHDNNEKLPRMGDLVEMAKFPDKDWLQVRTLGPVSSFRTHWVKFKTKTGKVVEFGKPCLAYDRLKGEVDSTLKCPYCEFDKEHARASVEYYVNGIVRDEQENEPAKKGQPTKSEAASGFKEKGSRAWTPVKAVRFPAGVAASVKKLKELNKHKTADGKVAFPISNVKYGCDLMIYFDKDGDGSKKYTIQKGDASPLTDEEQEYLVWNIQQDIPMEDLKSAKKEAARILASFGEQDEDEYHDEDLDDDDEDTPKKKPVTKGKGKAKPADDEDDFDDEDEEPAPKSKAKAKKVADEDDFDDEEDEDEPVAKKPAPKGKAKPADDDFDDEEDEEPAPKAKAKGKKPPVEDDDFDDEDDEEPAPKAKAKGKKPPVDDDFDDEDEEPAPKAKAKAKAKPADDEDDFDDEDEEPAAKKRPAAKGKKPPVEDDDDFDDEDDEEPAPKAKGKAKPAPKAKGKAKPADDEDDDDFDD